MKAEELATQLRIGNLIKTDDGIICSIECIESKQFTEWNSGNDYSITAKEIGTKDNYLNCINDSWKPIPLSEEVLLKCGATLDGIEYIIKASALPIKIRLHSGIAYCEFGNVYLGDRVKYLHELQNLVFALCGREMEVSL